MPARLVIRERFCSSFCAYTGEGSLWMRQVENGVTIVVLAAIMLAAVIFGH